jgi:hypothetical protein
MSDLSQVFEMDDILRVSIVSQVEHHLYFPESFLCTFCMNVPYHEVLLAFSTAGGRKKR